MAVEEKEYSPESERKTVLQRMRFAWKSRLPALARIALTAISLVGVHFIGRELYKTVKTSVAVEAATDSSEYVAWDGKDVGKLVGKNLYSNDETKGMVLRGEYKKVILGEDGTLVVVVVVRLTVNADGSLVVTEDTLDPDQVFIEQ